MSSTGTSEYVHPPPDPNSCRYCGSKLRPPLGDDAADRKCVECQDLERSQGPAALRRED